MVNAVNLYNSLIPKRLDLEAFRIRTDTCPDHYRADWECDLRYAAAVRQRRRGVGRHALGALPRPRFRRPPSARSVDAVDDVFHHAEFLSCINPDAVGGLSNDVVLDLDA